MRVKLNNKPIADVIDLYLLIKQLIVDVMIDLLYSHIPVHQLGGRLVFKVYVQFNKISNGPKTPVGVQLLSFIMEFIPKDKFIYTSNSNLILNHDPNKDLVSLS